MAWKFKIKDTTAGLSNAWLPYEIYIVTDDFQNISFDEAMDSAMGGAPFSADFTIGAEASNTINVAIQLNDSYGDDLSVSGSVRAYLSDNSDGSSLINIPPTGGVAIGTDGLLIPMVKPMINTVSTHGNLAISATTDRFKTVQTIVYTINGVQYSYAAADNLEFTANYVITASKFGIFLLQLDKAGTFSTKAPSATQAYADAATALAALPAPDYGNVSIGYIAIENNAGDWTANTDDLTNGSDVTTAAFTDATEYAIDSNAKTFDLVSEADGDIDINIYETGVRTMYLVLIMPDGSLEISTAITFA